MDVARWIQYAAHVLDELGEKVRGAQLETRKRYLLRSDLGLRGHESPRSNGMGRGGVDDGSVSSFRGVGESMEL